MALVVPDVGENVILEAIVNRTAPQNLVLRLFQSNTTPAEGDTAGTYTEATFSGYTAITLTGASWAAASGGSIAFAQQTFTHNGGGVSNDIYGYYLTQLGSGILVLAERDATAPVTIANDTETIKITPTLTAS